ncbi:glycoside hydrolase family 1 protein [Acetobacter sp.]|uniref:glycoside hydrolase family 1 protein n=1 Tax=Acetobacter sp. TaxID=440 RepID=UPI0025BD36DA|nr:family 1 glycosylhydrolase [Acetobacter sp.]MCH4092065.1 family 1 glycosylhydrolase [Acetobacter sp.]MCI1300681.1 family 1 glycosylhydrolase [Acetobacter sp.]MCI1317615.1 family 1 glycosylhydrolase [Acetobacter sp.]
MSALTRRGFLSGTASGLLARTSSACAESRSGNLTLPFLWGAATAGYQTEGNSTNADIWFLERMAGTVFKEQSGQADDFYTRYQQDILLLASLGLNSFRFSIEWSRIEPEPGVISHEAIAHYRNMLRVCHEHNLIPCVTYSHFACPLWFAARGGWEAPDAADHFLHYCELASRSFGDLIGTASVFNEPDLHKLILHGSPLSDRKKVTMLAQAAKACHSPTFSYYLSGDPQRVEIAMISAYLRAYDVIKSGPGRYPLGLTLAMTDDQAVGDPLMRDRKRAEIYDAWLYACREKGDFIGVQVYTRSLTGPNGAVAPPAGSRSTTMGWEFYPECVEGACSYAASVSQRPVIVTENGIATDDDSERQDYIRRAVESLDLAIADGIDIRGYYHWSFLDSFEWAAGYRPRMGLVAVDRQTEERMPKQSAFLLGSMRPDRSVAWKL